MSKLVMKNHLTVDGVVQAPGRPDEDRRGGFEHRSGRRRFADGGPSAKLQLIDAKPTTTGVLTATYRPAEPPAHSQPEGKNQEA